MVAKAAKQNVGASTTALGETGQRQLTAARQLDGARDLSRQYAKRDQATYLQNRNKADAAQKLGGSIEHRDAAVSGRVSKINSNQQIKNSGMLGADREGIAKGTAFTDQARDTNSKIALGATGQAGQQLRSMAGIEAQSLKAAADLRQTKNDRNTALTAFAATTAGGMYGDSLSKSRGSANNTAFNKWRSKGGAGHKNGVTGSLYDFNRSPSHIKPSLGEQFWGGG